MSKERFIDDFLNDIIEAISEIREFTEGMTFDTFVHDRKTRKAVTKCIEDIGIAISEHIPEHIYKNYPEVPWSDWCGIRNIVTHQYFGIDWAEVWKTVSEDLEPLKNAVVQMIRDLHLNKPNSPGL
ncbi:MAG: DUF86 domain-containing protein [Nitrospirae bacterium]|nr:DUF86 domain-containing protein [Nitrospirota bacterium]